MLPRRAYQVILGVLLLALAVLAGMLVLGVSPWAFLAAYAIFSIVALVPRHGWGIAALGSIGSALFVATWVLVVDPYVGVRLDVAQAGALTIVAVVLAVAVGRGTDPVRVRRPPVLAAVVMLAPAVLSVGAIVVAGLIRGRQPITWAMSGDAQLNTVLSRLIGDTDGESIRSVDVLSLAQGLMAMVHLPGRDAVPAPRLLIADVLSQSQLWLLMIVVSSVLAGYIAWRVTRGVGRVVGHVATLGGALVPLTWYLTGYAIPSGFYNVSLAFIVIELSVLIALLVRDPWTAAVAQLMVAVTMLSAWTPMAVIALFFALVSAVAAFRGGRPRARVVVWVIAVLQLPVFGVLFVLPTYLSQGDNLSQAGTIVGLPEAVFWLVVALGVLTVLLLVRGPAGSADEDGTPDAEDSRRVGWTILQLLVGTVTGVLALYVINRRLPEPWGYYPIKYAWIALTVLVVLLWAAGCLVVAQLVRRRGIRAVALVAVFGVLASILNINSPPMGGVTSYFPLLSLAKNPPIHGRTIDTLSAVAGTRVMFVKYFGGDDDLFVNEWQFQLSARRATDPIRSYAYQRVESPASICEAAATWGGGVRLVTSSRTLADRVTARCGDDVTPELRTPAG